MKNFGTWCCYVVLAGLVIWGAWICPSSHRSKPTLEPWQLKLISQSDYLYSREKKREEAHTKLLKDLKAGKWPVLPEAE